MTELIKTRTAYIKAPDHERAAGEKRERENHLITIFR